MRAGRFRAFAAAELERLEIEHAMRALQTEPT
jgi:hypothetical protein